MVLFCNGLSKEETIKTFGIESQLTDEELKNWLEKDIFPQHLIKFKKELISYKNKWIKENNKLMGGIK